MTIGIIGLGLIGGSLGLALKKKNHRIIGYDNNAVHISEALRYGLIDSSANNNEQLVKECDILLITTPVEVIEQMVNSLLDLTKSHQIIIDCGSTKESICKKADNSPLRDRFVAGHPIAGTEFSGPSAAIPDLFKGKKMIFCDVEKSSKRASTIARQLFAELEMDLMFMSAKEHDIHLAYVSHLSHVSSFALSLTALEIEKSKDQILNLSGSGFASTVRLAKSNPVTWKSIFLANKNNLLVAVKEYQNQLKKIEELLEDEDSDELIKIISKAGEIRKILK